METRHSDSPIQNVLAQIEGLSYRDADWVLVAAREKLKDYSSVQKYIPKVRRESQLEFEDKT